MQVSALNKLTRQFVPNININKVNNSEWIINPDLSTVDGVDKSEWVIEGNTVRLENQSEKDAKKLIAQTALLEQIYKNYRDAEFLNLSPAGIVQLAQWCGEGNVKALANRTWILAFYDERDAKLALVEGGDLTIDPNPSVPYKPYSFREIKIVSNLIPAAI
jgi:hypothetical protein